MAGGFQKGNQGKPKGAVNKTTATAKELLLSAINGQAIHFNETMNQLREIDPKEWSKIMVSLFKFVAPEKLDIESQGKGISIPVQTWAKPKAKADGD